MARRTVLIVAGIGIVAAVMLIAKWKESQDSEPKEQYANLMRRAQDLAGRQRYSEALADLSLAKRAMPSESAPYETSANILIQANRFADALDEMRIAHEKSPEDGQLTLRLIEMTPPYLPASATEALARSALTHLQGDPRAHYLLALAIENSNDPTRFDEATHELTTALHLGPSQPQTMIALGRLLLKQKKPEAALAHLESAWSILETARTNHVGNPVEITQLRRTCAFWMAQAYNREGQYRMAKVAQARLARIEEGLRTRQTTEMRNQPSVPPGTTN